MLTYDLIRLYADRRFYLVRDLPFIKYEYYNLSGFYFRRHANSWDPTTEATPTVQASNAVRPRRIAFLGAAQVFGPYEEFPVPFAVARQLDCQCLNLGVGGAGPEFFMNRPELLEYTNQCDAAVIAFMAGRSISIRDYAINAASNNHWKRPGEAAYTDSLKILQTLWNEGADSSRIDLGNEIRDSYATKMLQLMRSIHCPKILLWISDRHHHEISVCGGSFWSWLGRFPYLIDTPCFERLVQAADGLAYAVVPPSPRILKPMPREQRCTK